MQEKQVCHHVLWRKRAFSLHPSHHPTSLSLHVSFPVSFSLSPQPGGLSLLHTHTHSSIHVLYLITWRVRGQEQRECVMPGPFKTLLRQLHQRSSGTYLHCAHITHNLHTHYTHFTHTLHTSGTYLHCAHTTHTFSHTQGPNVKIRTHTSHTHTHTHTQGPNVIIHKGQRLRRPKRAST